MKHFSKLLKVLAIVSIFVACGRQRNNPVDNSAKDTPKDTVAIAKNSLKLPKDTLDTILTYQGDIIMQIKHGEKIIEKRRFEFANGTSYFSNGKPQHEQQRIRESYSSMDRMHNEYYSNGQLKSVWETGDVFGCGNRVGNELQYDSLGHLLSKSTYKHKLPKGAIGCHDTRTVISITEYHPNGKVKLKKHIDTCYECDECDCGTWEYYNKQGKLIKKEKYEPCGDGYLDCND